MAISIRNRALASAAVAGFALWTGAEAAHASEGGQSPYIRGYRDLMMGIVPPQSGLYFRNDVIFYSGEIDRTVLNGRVEVGLKEELFYEIPSFTYVTNVKIFGGQWAFNVAPTLVSADLRVRASAPPGAIERDDSITDFGDMVITPVVLGWHGSNNTHWNVGLSVVLPTGRYDSDDLANTSLNYYALIPQVGFSYLNPESGWDASIGAAYTLPDRNDDTDYKSGQMLHVDTSVTKAFGKVRAGLVGYAMIQTTEDHGSGAVLGSNEAEIYGVGPIIAYSAEVGGKPLTVLAKWAHEFGADNTPQGDTVTLALSMKF